MIVHGFVTRPTKDVDLFTEIDDHEARQVAAACELGSDTDPKNRLTTASTDSPSPSNCGAIAAHLAHFPSTHQDPLVITGRPARRPTHLHISEPIIDSQDAAGH